MRIEQIIQVLELARTGNMGRAADNLFMSQPNLSLSLKKLEDEIGQEIFIRNPKGLYLSDFGKDFVKYAGAVKFDFNNLLEFCRFSQNTTKTFSLATVPQTWVFQIIGELTRLHEDENISFSVCTPGTARLMLDSISTGASEICLCSLAPSQNKHIKQLLKKEGMEYHPIGEGHFCLLAGKDHPFCRQGLSEVSTQMISDYPLIIIGDDNSVLHRQVYEEAGLLKSSDTSLITVSSGGAMHSILEHSDAVAFTVHYAKAYEKYSYNPNLRVLGISDYQQTYELGWFKLRNSVLSTVGQEFIDRVENL